MQKKHIWALYKVKGLLEVTVEAEDEEDLPDKADEAAKRIIDRLNGLKVIEWERNELGEVYNE